MIGLFCFGLAVLASPFKSKLRLIQEPSEFTGIDKIHQGRFDVLNVYRFTSPALADYRGDPIYFYRGAGRITTDIQIGREIQIKATCPNSTEFFAKPTARRRLTCASAHCASTDTDAHDRSGKHCRLPRRIDNVDFVSRLLVASLLPKHRTCFPCMSLR
jgi:hypothetical protein